mgnify:CR=1 FL=1
MAQVCPDACGSVPDGQNRAHALFVVVRALPNMCVMALAQSDARNARDSFSKLVTKQRSNIGWPTLNDRAELALLRNGSQLDPLRVLLVLLVLLILLVLLVLCKLLYWL